MNPFALAPHETSQSFCRWSFVFALDALIGLLFFMPLEAADATKPPEALSALAPAIEIQKPGVTMTLLAEDPDLVTPTGIDVDSQGRIWLIASHTHFRPEGYIGPEHDEILVFDATGKNRRVFYEKTDATMQLILGSDGWVYLAERDRIVRVRDTDGDGIGDLEELLATLDTVADYPHNGLSGMAWHPDGGLVFALGENFGKDWTLTAPDGSTETGRGEGGVFRCRRDGTQLRRIARGFWNPFGLLVRKDGEIFAAENDPGSRPPCRLLHIVEGGDYGFQWIYGSAPVHPFIAWNGELRGTLGMVHPCGEGPCAVVELGGGVLIPSWSNHRIDYFPLIRHGAGYTSHRVELLTGSDFFRPVCMALGPDNSFYLTDWVSSSYAVHGRGRLWKLTIDHALASWMVPDAEPMNDDARLSEKMRAGISGLSIRQLLDHARGNDPYLSDAALTSLARESGNWSLKTLHAMPILDRVWALVALRRVDLSDGAWVREFLHDSDPDIQFECLRWIADGVLLEFSGAVEAILSREDLEYQIFEAALACSNTLKGNPGAGVTDAKVLAERVLNPTTPARLKGFALRLLPADTATITIPLLEQLFAEGDPSLSLEVVHTLSEHRSADASNILARIAENESYDIVLRSDAVAGLSSSDVPEHRALLLTLSNHENASLRNEALRALRMSSCDDATALALIATAKSHPDSAPLVAAILDSASMSSGRPPLENTQAWLARLEALPGKADLLAGRRVYFHAKVGLCSTCHRHSGRGNVVGPDLSLIARQGDSASLLRSILEPHRDVSPQFYPTVLELQDGTTFTGILLRSSSTDVFRDVSGKERTFQKSDIVQSTELKTSLMPQGLSASMTDGELRDILAFLSDDHVSTISSHKD